jgi:hypothetical protein
MSTMVLIVAAWTLLCAVAYVAAVAEAVVHLLPPLTGRWHPAERLAPTLAQERRA